MAEFTFELNLCAHLKAQGALVSRQLGTTVAEPGSRVIDIIIIKPGPRFANRQTITPATIPARAIDADIGVGRARYWKDALPAVHPDRGREVTERAIEIGFFEAERRNGRLYVRQAARYPDWVDRLTGIENKPDLDRPADLEAQLRQDLSLGLLDEVILATESYVTGAHLNRLPDEVGVWRFTDNTIEVIREPTQLSVDEPGYEIVDSQPSEKGASAESVR